MKRIVHIGYILFGFIILNTKVAECITCLSCLNVADLSNCKHSMVCNANQTCYIEKILSPVDFKPIYNTGCKELDYCKLQLCNKNAYGDGNSRKKRADNDLVLCSECCFQDSCNAEGCGYKQPASINTQCFKCDEVYEGGPQCTETEDCDLTLYACSVTTHPNSHKPGAYELGCKFRRAQCQVYINLAGEQRDENVKCCDTTLCNPSPYNRKINKTVIEHDFKCPEGIIRPTTKPPLPPPTTTFPAATKSSTSTVSPTFDSHTPPTIASTSFSASTPNVTQSSTPPPPTTTTSLPTTESTVPTTTTTTPPTTKSTVKTTTTTTQPTTKSTVPTTTTTTQPTTKSTVKTTTTTTQPTTKSTVKTTTTTTQPTTKSTVPTTTTTTLPTTKSTVPTTTTTTIPTTKSTVPTTTTTTLPTTKTTTPVPTTKTTTTLAASTGVPPKTIPPVTMRSICPSHLTQRVPAEYIHVYGDKCYEFVPYVGSWMYARTDCHRKRGHMLSITNAGEQAFISNLISKGYVITTLWLGLDDRVNEGQFNWDTGVKVNYTNWAPGRNVDPYHDQRDCVVMIVARDGKWDDVDCDALVNGRIISYNWICQYNFETQVISALPNKPVDGNWSHWHKWSACSVTCGTGSQSRTRDCNNPAPQHGGHVCFGLGTETSTCNIKDCPHWMPFYEAAPCSVTCGVGFVQLKRNCSTGNTQDCHGNEYSEKPCHLKDCSN